MRWLIFSVFGAALFGLGVAVGGLALPHAASQPRQEPPPQLATDEAIHHQFAANPVLPVALEHGFDDTPGRTRCSHGRKASIAPVPLHSVTEVLVKPGDVVKRDQVLVKIDDDEQQAEVRARKANLERAIIESKDARRYLETLEKAYQAGAVPEGNLLSARAAAAKAEQDEKAAKAAVESGEAELEHFTVTAPIDGVVSHLDVYPGLVSRPGTTVWGEILDLSEIDVFCELSPEQVERVAVGHMAEVRVAWKKDICGVAKVIFVGIAADKKTGLVPVLLRLSNTENGLRCEIPVSVRFTTKTAADATVRNR